MKNHPQEVYFDSSATFLKPNLVSSAEKTYYDEINANPHSVDFPNAYTANEVLANTRQQVQTLINAAHENEIIFTSSATFSLNQVAFGLQDFLHEGDEILLSDLEHAANIVP